VIAAPQPVIETERAQPDTKAKAGGKNSTGKGAVRAAALHREFRHAANATGAPAPKKSRRRRRSGEENQERAALRIAFVQMQLKRVFRKVANWTGNDDRDETDDFRTVDTQWWHQHRQRTVDIFASDQGRGFRSVGPNNLSPTL
jgi:hypothetical protein